MLPKNLGEALAALRASEVFAEGFGDDPSSIITPALKEAELARFKAEAGERSRAGE